jgi:hypothetical protein
MKLMKKEREKKRKILLWIDDNPSDEYRDLIQETANNKGLEVLTITGVSALQQELENLDANNNNTKIDIRGIILDLMIHGADSLSDFGFSEVKWSDDGNAGKFLLEYVIRNKELTDENLNSLELYNKKMLILTVKSDAQLEDFEKYGENIVLIHKYEQSDVDQEKYIRNWINEL